MITLSKIRLLQLLTSGDLVRYARDCKTVAELAIKIGLTPDAYDSCARRIRGSGGTFPRFHELKDAWKPEMNGLPEAETPDEDPRFAHGNAYKVNVPALSEAETTAWIKKLRADFKPAQAPPLVITEVKGMTTPLTAAQVTAITATMPQSSKPVEPLKEWTTDGSIEERKDKLQISALKQRLAKTLDELATAKEMLLTAEEADRMRKGVDPIVPRESSSAQREATAVALASDWHIEERVDSAAVNGVNDYNLEIAKHRAERFFSGFIYLTKYHSEHFTIRDALLWLGGDLITGYLREENLEHNELSPVFAIATLHAWLADGIRAYLAALPQIELLTIVCNSGNHGRLTEKVRPATREQNSIEWLLYANLAREFANEPRVKFNLPYGSQTYVDIYDFTVRFTHGDEAKFGGGVGGIMIPLKKAIARWNTVKTAAWTNVGHFHQYHDLPTLVVNGSLIGYNTYALSIGADFETPRQAFYLVDRSRGKCMSSSLWVDEAGH